MAWKEARRGGGWRLLKRKESTQRGEKAGERGEIGVEVEVREGRR